ncbi:hypothetical protein Tco_1368828 [Tanacetum coccineum]
MDTTLSTPRFSFYNESAICIVKNLVFHSKTKHIEIRHHFTIDSNEKKLIQMIQIHTDQNVADLLTKAFNVGRFQYLIARSVNAKEHGEVDIGLRYMRRNCEQICIDSDEGDMDRFTVRRANAGAVLENVIAPTLRGSCGKLDAQPTPPDEGVMVKIRSWVNSGHSIRKHVNVLGTCGELDAFVSIPDEGDMTFLRKKGKSGAAVGKLVLLQEKIYSGIVTPLFATMLIQPQAYVGEGSGQPTDSQHPSTTASPSTVVPILVLSSSQPKKTQTHRKTKRKATEISQSSGPTTLVADETVHDERGDSVERVATTC